MSFSAYFAQHGGRQLGQRSLLGLHAPAAAFEILHQIPRHGSVAGLVPEVL